MNEWMMTIFAIKNFKIIVTTGQYQPLPNEYMIYLFHGYNIRQKITWWSYSNPRHVFLFMTQESMYAKVNDNITLTSMRN